jgi:LPXTG-motif cell wall-anchored protein
MRLTPLRRSGLLGAATVAAVATLALVTTAFAQPDKPAPDSGDDRADSYIGNVEWNWPTACTVGGLTGTSITSGFTFTGGKNTPDLDITAIPDGVTITGVVVKGAEAYNVYLAGKLGELPWNDLRAPDKNDKAPEISHWYACGVKKDQTSSSSSSSSSTSSSTVTHSSTPSSSETTPSSSEVAATTTTTAAAGPATDNLASTGFGSAWLVGLGAALLAVGAAVLLVLRRRRA